MLIGLILAGHAYAYEDRGSIDFGIGYAQAFDDIPGSSAGIGIRGGASWGIDDIWTLRGELAWNYHPGADADLHVGILGGELLYILDVLEWVPFFGAGLDALLLLPRHKVESDIAAHAVVGIDYILSINWVIGLDARLYVLPFSLSSQEVDPLYLNISVRMSWLFD